MVLLMLILALVTLRFAEECLLAPAPLGDDEEWPPFAERRDRGEWLCGDAALGSALAEAERRCALCCASSEGLAALPPPLLLLLRAVAPTLPPLPRRWGAGTEEGGERSDTPERLGDDGDGDGPLLTNGDDASAARGRCRGESAVGAALVLGLRLRERAAAARCDGDIAESKRSALADAAAGFGPTTVSGPKRRR